MGSVLIALYTACLGLVTQLNYTDIKDEGLCEYNPPPKCGLTDLFYFLKYFNAFQGNILFGASLAYFVGILINSAITATVYLYVMSARTILIAIHCLTFVISGHTVSSCTMRSNQTVVCVVSTVFSCLCNIYILIIVKSYRSKMVIIKTSETN